MSIDLDKLDQAASNWIRGYQAHGEFCVLLRTASDGNGNVRLIYPKTDVTLLIEMLRKAAAILADNNARNVKKSTLN